ncbi:hypothetical protein H0O01_03005 [Candidatus Micrarchaeota archaeon]|nr:hypothetical protein [Candidatus Micrarchaeota archaeon]
MRNLAFAIHPHEMDVAIRRAKSSLRLLEAEPCKAPKERKWPIPEPVQVAMLKAMHPEMEGARIKRLLRDGRMRLPQKKYHLEEVKRAAVLALVKHLGKNPLCVPDEDFERNGLGWLVNRYGSSFKALKSVGLLSEKDRHAHRFKKKPWTFSNRENRIKALREAEEKLGGKPRETRLWHLKDEFPKVHAMVINYYHGSVFEAYVDAGLATRKDEEYMRAGTERLKRKIAREGG